ncbi:MAG TPA: alpha/beta hydrolase [Streptosporangiaceae bacterium]|jgi:pimeloyl-ACP methyl ester carboxylesterase|nr:alpha/beta hydrolase [Streptosporangiaceae bacterium]
MSTATVNGAGLGYVEQGQGEPVLFVHGGVGDYRVWDQQMSAFGAGYRVIALSCRGYWPNPKLRAGESITLDTFVGDLAQFARALGAGPVRLAGHSSPGGFGGLRLAAQHPELLRTLVLLEPPAFPLLGVSIPPRPAEVIKLVIRHPRAGVGFIKFGATGIGPAIKAFERGDDAGALRAFMAANTSDAVVAGIPEEMFRRFVDNAGPLKAQIKAGFPPFAASDARAIRVPALLVSGAQSPAHLTAVTGRLAKLVPDADRLTIAGATHNMFTSHPAQFNTGVLRFIRSHSAADR